MNTSVNVEVKRNKNENNMSVIKRFTRRVQGSGILPKVRSIRYLKRKPSDYTKKVDRLNSIGRKAKIMDLIKLGKLADNPRGKRRN